MPQPPVWTTPLMSFLLAQHNCRARHSSSGSPRNPRNERKSSLVAQMLWCSKWWLIKMLWKAFLEMQEPALRRGWSSQIPFCWQREGSRNSFNCCSKFTSWCLSSSSQESPRDTNQHLAGWTDSFLAKLMLQPYFVVIPFEISKDQKHKL